MFATYNYFRQYNDQKEIENYKAFYREFSNSREFGGEFSNYDHLIKNRFMNMFGHVWNIVLRKRPGSILDVGCGNGVNLPLANVFPSIDYHGLDYAEKSLENAKRQYPNITFHVQDAFHMEFEPQRFDMTVLSSVLILYREERDQLDLLREVARVTKDDGIIVLIVWNASPLLVGSIRLSRWIGKILKQRLPEDFMGLHFKPQEIRALADKANLKVEEAIHTGHLYGILESVRYLNMSKYNRTFGTAESEGKKALPQNILRDLQQQAGRQPWLTAAFYRIGQLAPGLFSMFSIYILSKPTNS